VLLGQRYGWRPLPSEIDQSELDLMQEHIKTEDRKLVFHENGGWYRLDENNVPPEYILQPREGDNRDKYTWGEIEGRLRTILLKAAIDAKLESNEIDKYRQSATEQECREGAMKGGTGHAFCYFRRLRNLEETEDHKAFADFTPDWKLNRESYNDLLDLKVELGKNYPGDHIHPFTAELNKDGNGIVEVTDDHLQEFCKRVFVDLKDVISNQIDELEYRPRLEIEKEQHKDFLDDRLQGFLGRDYILKAVDDYIRGDDPGILMIYGKSGLGKSAVIAKCVVEAEKQHPDATKIYRFIGVTPESSDIRSLLESVCIEIRDEFNLTETIKREGAKPEVIIAVVPSDIKELVPKFKEFLEKIPDDRKLVLFLDALDQLSPSENAWLLHWLPRELKPNVGVVVSALDRDDQYGQPLDKLKILLPEGSRVEVTPLNRKEGGDILEGWFVLEGRKLKDFQKKGILDKFKIKGSALYLKVAFNEACGWRSYETELPDGADGIKGLPDTTEGMIADMLWRLERDENYGEEHVRITLGFLASARHGLTEDEIMDLLALDEEYLKFFNDTHKWYTYPVITDKESGQAKLPIIVWSRFYHDLEPYLTERSGDNTSLFGFYHRQVEEVVKERYLGDPETKKKFHRGIAGYFSYQPYFYGVGEKRLPNYRKCSELPYQQSYGYIWEVIGKDKAFNDSLTDLEFIEAKCTAGQTYDLVADYNRLSAGRGQLGPIIKTARKREDCLGIWCPHCLAWFEIKNGQLGSVIECQYCHNHLKINTFSIKGQWQPSPAKQPAKILERLPEVHVSQGVHEFAEFIRNQVHILEKWPYLALQQASNWTSSTAPVCKAEIELLPKSEPPPFIRWINRPHEQDPCLLTLSGHPKGVTVCSWSPDGSKMASGSIDGVCRIWDINNGTELIKLMGHFNRIRSCYWSPDGALLLSNSDDGEGIIWNSHSGEKFSKIYYGVESRHSPSWSPDGKMIVGGSTSGPAKIWNAASQHIVCSLQSPQMWYEKILKFMALDDENEYSACAWSPDGKYITVAANAHVEIWDFAMRQIAFSFEGHSDTVSSCAWSNDSKKVVSGSIDRTLRIWDLKKQECLFTLTGHSTPVQFCTWSPDDSKIASLSTDGQIIIWDSQTGHSVTVLGTQMVAAGACAWSPDGRMIATGSRFGQIKIWDANLEITKITDANHSAPVKKCHYSPDGSLVGSLSANGESKLWDSSSGELVTCLSDVIGPVRSQTWSPNGAYIALASFARELCIWSTNASKIVAKFPSKSYGTRECNWSQDASFIAAVWRDGKLYMWGAEDKKLLFSESMVGFFVHIITIIKLHYLGLLFDFNNKVHFDKQEIEPWLVGYDLIDPDPIDIYRNWALWNQSLSWSPDCRMILVNVVGSYNVNYKIVNVESSKTVFIIKAFSDIANWLQWCWRAVRKFYLIDYTDVIYSRSTGSCKWSQDGKMIVLGTPSGSVRMLDASNGRLLQKLYEHSASVNACSISPDGSMVLSGSSDKKLIVWDRNIGEKINTLERHTAEIVECTWSQDNRRIISGSHDRTVRIWDMNQDFGPLIFPTFGNISAIECSPSGDDIAVADTAGRIYLLRPENIPIGPPILTPWHSPLDQTYAFGCTHCRNWSEINKSDLGTELNCPKCGKRVKLNPFTINADWRPIAKAWKPADPSS